MSDQEFKLLLDQAQIARKQGNRAQALAFFEKALTIQPNHPILPVDVAVELRELGRFDEAIATLNALLERIPDSIHAYSGLAQIARKQGNRAQALAFFEKALTIQSNHPTLPVDVAVELRELGRFDEAIATLNALLERIPDSIHAYSGLAQIARKQGNRAQALAFFEKALTIQPNHSTLPADIAVELKELGRFDEAMARLEAHAEHLNPALKWHHQGLIFLAQANHEDAIRCYQAGVLASPTDPRCYQAMIGEFLKFGLFKQAQEIIEQAERNITTPNRFYLYKIRSLMNQGLYEEAISTCEQMLVQYPQDMTIAHHLIDLHIRVGNFFEAEKLLDQNIGHSVEEQQYFARQRSELAKARYDLPLALELAHQALALNTSNKSLKAYLALVELLMGSTAFAKQELNDLQAQVPNMAYRKIWPSAIGNIQGRLYSEMRTNPFAQALLANAWQQPRGAERIRAIADALQAEPSFIGSAIFLLSELRYQGAFSNSANHELTSDAQSQTLDLALKIPKTIVQFWNEPIPPEDVAQMMGSWRLQNPDFDHLVFDDERAEQFLIEHCDAKVVRAYRMANYPAMRADVFRLAYLSVNGGVYADADDLCRHSIASWLNNDVELILIQEHLGSIGNNLMAAMPNHPFISATLERVVDQILGKQGDIWFTSGPGAITLLFCNYYLNELSQLRIPSTIQIIDCYEIGKRVSIQLPRQYKQTTKSWSSPKNQNKPIYRLANSFIRRKQ